MTELKLRIGCDIGGVVKNLADDEPVPDAVGTLGQLLLDGHTVVFVSKCGDNYRERITEWLGTVGLDRIPVHFCRDYADKVGIATRERLDVMIDDKLQVLSSFPTTIKKVWFCNDVKKIAGTRRYQPDLLGSVVVCGTWAEVMASL